MMAFNLLKPTSNGENELGQEIFEHKQVAVFFWLYGYAGR